MKHTVRLLTTALLTFVPTVALLGQEREISRTPAGKPDFTGTYDAATLTPFQRPPELADTPFLTPATRAQRIVLFTVDLG